MATDKNSFDDFLKAKLYRDIIFRIIVWILIAGIAVYLSSKQLDFNPNRYFEDSTKKILPLLNSIGVIALLLSLPALYLKDLEHVSTMNETNLSSLASYWGGMIRRLASDLTLWLIGAFVTLLSVLITFFIFPNGGQFSMKDVFTIGVVGGSFLTAIALVAMLNILIRRAEPPLANTPPFSLFMGSAWRVTAFYIFSAIFILGYGHFSR